MSHFLRSLSITVLAGCATSEKQDSNPEGEAEERVIIVGAGAAGLAAAKRFEASGVPYQILEATDHYGGRVQKNDELADFPIDIGGEWIHTDKSILNVLLDLPGNEPDIETILYQPMEMHYLNGGALEVVPESWLENFYADYITEYKFKDSTWYDYLSENFASEVSAHIVYNAKVSELDYSGDEIVFTTEDGAVYTADKAIVTVSIGVLKSGAITFVPELTAEKQEAIEAVEFLPGFKLFMKFDEKFYPDVIAYETPTGEKSFYDAAYLKESEDHVLALLSTGVSAAGYYQLDGPEAIVDAALAELDSIYEGAASAHFTGEYVYKDWGQLSTTLGTWTSTYTREPTHDALKAPLDNRVFFAGETYISEDPNFMRSSVHGAILSGYDAAETIMALE